VPRHRRGPYRKTYSSDGLRDAVESKLDNFEQSYTELADEYQVKASTLRDHVEREIAGKPVGKSGRMSTLPLGIEVRMSHALCVVGTVRNCGDVCVVGVVVRQLYLACWVGWMAASYMPQGQGIIMQKAAELALAVGVVFASSTGKPSRKWLRGFLGRHHLALRSVKRMPPDAPAKTTIDDWFAERWRMQHQFNFKPRNIWNMDESGWARFNDKGKAVVSKDMAGKTAPHLYKDFRDHITLVACVNAEGVPMPPSWITIGSTTKNFVESTRNATPGAYINATSKH
jgi:hypothetical protein